MKNCGTVIHQEVFTDDFLSAFKLLVEVNWFFFFHLWRRHMMFAPRCWNAYNLGTLHSKINLNILQFAGFMMLWKGRGICFLLFQNVARCSMFLLLPPGKRQIRVIGAKSLLKRFADGLVFFNLHDKNNFICQIFITRMRGILHHWFRVSHVSWFGHGSHLLEIMKQADMLM